MNAHRKPVPSPCISICQMDESSGWCTGCLRTIDEIAAWSTLDEPAKLAVWRRLPARRVEARRLRQDSATAPATTTTTTTPPPPPAPAADTP